MIIVEPTVENGAAYVFARIAEELGRRRPDIPLLAVAGPTTEAELTSCQLDLRNCGRVEVMPRPAEPRRYWERTALCPAPLPGLGASAPTRHRGDDPGHPVLGSDRPGVRARPLARGLDPPATRPADSRHPRPAHGCGGRAFGSRRSSGSGTSPRFMQKPEPAGGTTGAAMVA